MSGETCSNIVHIIKFSNRREVLFAKLQSFSFHHLQLLVHLGIKLDSTVADIDFKAFARFDPSGQSGPHHLPRYNRFHLRKCTHQRRFCRVCPSTTYFRDTAPRE